MSADKSKIYTATSQQWRFVDSNRPEPGMPPLVPATLPYNNNKTYEERRSGEYFYKDSNQHASSRFSSSSQTNQQVASRFSAQSRLSKYK